MQENKKKVTYSRRAHKDLKKWMSNWRDTGNIDIYLQRISANIKKKEEYRDKEIGRVTTWQKKTKM